MVKSVLFNLDITLYDHLMHVMCLNSPQIIPYTDAIPEGGKIGMALYFQGVAFATGNSYVFILLTTSHIVFSNETLIKKSTFIHLKKKFKKVFYSTHRFEINLIAGTREAGDVVFHMFFGINGAYLIYNTRRSGKWENAERTSGCPISKGSAFDMFFVTKTEGYEVK